MAKVAPSILSADFTRLGKEIKLVEKAGADYLHLDVMDGHFVPNLTFGPLVVKACRKLSKLPLDVHLMIENPDKYIAAFAQAGATIISIQAEASADLERDLAIIGEKKVKPAVVINPATPVSAIERVLDRIYLVLVMSVNPGFEKQAFMKGVLPKVIELRERRLKASHNYLIEIDGGINLGTAKTAVEAGVDILVAGSAIFYDNNPAKIVKELKKIEP